MKPSHLNPSPLFQALRTYREKEYAASQLVTQKTTMTHRGGTRVYMAPELIRTKRFSRECDVFSMGVVLLEISTMLPPNQKLFDFEKEYMAKFGERGYLPTCLVNLIFDCLKLNNPSNRPSFAQIFSTLLQNQKTIQQCPITSRRQLLKTIDEIVVFLSSQRQASAMNPAASSVMTSAWFKAEDSGEASSESRGSKAAILGISTNGRKKGGDGLSGKAVGDDQYGDAGSNFISTGFTTNDDDNHTRGINFIRTKFKLKSKSRSMSDSAQAFVDTTSRHVKRNKIIAFNVVVIIALVIVLCVILIKPPGVSTSSSTFSNSTNSTIDNPSSNNNNSSSNNGTNTTTGNWAGANSFYLYALNDTDQDAVISHLKASNVRKLVL